MSVVSIQQQTPWWVPLANNLLIPMIGDAIERQRQRDENKKQNALRGEVLKQLGQLQGMADAQQGGSLLGGLPEPEGYNSNGWAQAYHKQDNPLGQFDAGIADLLPPTTQTQSRTPTPAEIQRAIAQHLATPRFSMLDPKAVQEYFAPYIQASEVARQEGFRNEAMNDYRNASTPLDQRNAVMSHVLRGTLPESTGNMVHGQYIADRPQFTPINTGGEYVFGSVDPTTGTYTEQSRMPMTLTPQQVQAGRINDRDFGENQRRWGIERNDRRTDADRNYELQRRGQPTITRLEDGRRIATYPDGTEKELTPDTAGFTSVEKGRLAQLETQRQGFIAQQTELQKALAQAQQTGNAAEVQSLTNSLSNVNTALRQIDGEINGMYTNKLNPPRNMTQPSTDLWTPDDNNDPSAYDIGAHMTGNAHGGPKGISTSYRTIRSKKDGSTYTHYGVDYKTPNGTEILVPDVGAPLTVTRVRNQPDGYGHYARLSGKVNGHRIELTVAHMQPGVNVKEGDVVNAGDLIGLSGNSGNSRGKNSGYHMHLECKIDGEYVDPTQARKIIAGWHSEVAQGDKQPAFIGPDVNGNERVITLGDFTELVRRAEAGQLTGAPNVRTEEDVKKWLESKGYKQSGADSASQTSASQVQNGQQEQAAQSRQWQGVLPSADKHWPGILDPFAATPAGETAEELQAAQSLIAAQSEPVQNNAGQPQQSAVASQTTATQAQGQQPQPVNSAGEQYAWYNPNVGEGYTQAQYEEMVQQAEAGNNGVMRTRQDVDDYLANKMGMERVTPDTQPQNVSLIPINTDITPGEMAASTKPMGRGRKPATKAGKTSYAELKDVIDGAAQRHGIDNELIQAIIEVESGWKPKARSHVGAMGLMQLMPKTAQGLGVRNAYDPEQNINGGSKYIADLIRRYGGDVNKALMAYNCGPGNVSKGRIPKSSRNYAKNVMSIYNRLKGQRQPALPPADTNLLPTESAPAQQRTPDGKGISWIDKNTNQPLRSASGEVFTDELYNKWAEMIDAGEYRDVGLNTRADLDKWLEQKGMRRVRPSVDRGLVRLNNANTVNVPADVYDADIAPEPPNPQTSPASFPAPSFTDELNGTRPQDLQGMLDDLNGIGRGEHPGWSAAYHNIFGRY